MKRSTNHSTTHPGAKSKWRRKFVHIANVCAWLLLIGVTSISLWLLLFRIDPGIEVAADFENSQSKHLATTLFFSKLDSIGKLSLALLGVLWAFVVYTGNKVEVDTAGKKSLFCATNCFLLLSFMAYFCGYDRVQKEIFDYATMDINAPIVRFWTQAQLVYFLFGTLFIVVTIILCTEEEKEAAGQ